MRIREIRAASVTNVMPLGRSGEEPPFFSGDNDYLNPMSRYLEFMGRGPHLAPPWPEVICIATAEDGTWGMGMTSHAGPVVPILNDYLGPLLIGENAFATERMWNLMVRCSGAYFGASGLASHAISAVDLALWDLKGKVLQRPVYELLGGPARERVHCYATGTEVRNLLDIGFDSIKIPCPRGAAKGTKALRETEAVVAEARKQIGDDGNLMMDMWSVQDAQHTIELGSILRPYQLKWLEDYVYPDDWSGYEEVRQRLPEQTLAAGERWYTERPYQYAAQRRLVDILQPDVLWVGGVTASIKIAAIAESSGREIAMHAGCNDPYGQHLCYALPGNRWGEMFVGASPGGNLMNTYRATSGMALPVNGYLVPSDAPGFGIEITLDGIEAAT
jgi:L-rhamnonate dehydratase